MTFNSIVFVICIDEVSPFFFFLCNLFFICGLFSFYILFSLLLVSKVNTTIVKKRKKKSVQHCECVCSVIACAVMYIGVGLIFVKEVTLCTDQ